MSMRPHYRVLAATVAALLAAGCSARGPAGSADSIATMGVHARAAQRIVLPGATAEATVAANAAPLRRLQPEAPEVIRLPDGTVGVKVAAQYFETVVACRQPDGSFSTNCPHQAEQRP